MISPKGEPVDFEIIQPLLMIPTLVEPASVNIFPVHFDTGKLTPFKSLNQHQFYIPDTRKSVGNVVFTFTVIARMGRADEYIIVRFNDSLVAWPEQPFEFDGEPCQFGEQTTVMTLSAAQWSTLITPGQPLSVVVQHEFSALIACFLDTFVQVQVDYEYAVEQDDAPYIAWRSFGKTLVGGNGDPHVQEAKLCIDPDGAMLLAHTDNSFRTTYSGAQAARVGADNEPAAGEPGHACLMSPTTGEVPGTIVTFSTTAGCEEA